jgi:hypothetical protein
MPGEIAQAGNWTRLSSAGRSVTLRVARLSRISAMHSAGAVRVAEDDSRMRPTLRTMIAVVGITRLPK